MKIAEAFVELRVDGRRGQAEAQAAAKGAAQAATAMFVQFFTAKVAIDQFVAFKNAASDLEQAIGGTEAQFGSFAGTINKAAESSASALGLSEAAFRTLTTQIGGLLQGLGFAQDEAATLAIDLTSLGADLAATYGGTTREAVEALGAAIRGEFDPLERFGVSLRVSAINAKAVEMGLADTTSAVSDNARATAALQIITEQTAAAQGQFAREADTTAGKEARLTAALENQRAEIGARLMPVYVQILGLVSKLGAGFSTLPGPMQTAIIVMLGVAAVAGPVNNVIQAFGGLKEAIKGMSTQAKVASTVVGLLGVALVVATAVYGNYNANKAKAKAITDEFVGALEAEAAGQKNATNELIAAKLAGEGMQSVFRGLGLEATSVAAFIRGETVPALQQLVDADYDATGGALRFLIDLSDKTGISTQKLVTMGDELAGLRTGFADAQEYIATTAAVVDELNASTETNIDATERATVGLGYASQAERDYVGDLEARGRAVDEAAAAQAEAEITDQLLREANALGEWIAATEEAEEAAAAYAAELNTSFDDAASAVNSFSEDAMEDLDAWQEELRNDIAAISEWQTNLIQIARETSPEFAAYLAEMGLAGAGLVADMAETPAELQESFDLWVSASRLAGRDMVAEMMGAKTGMYVAGKGVGNAGADGVAAGIYERIHVAVAAIGKLADDVMTEGAKAIWARSPSRRAAEEIGQPIAEGVALGIDDGADKIRDAIVGALEDAHADAIDAAEALVDAAQDALKSAWGRIDTRFGVEDAMERVSDAGTDLAERRQKRDAAQWRIDTADEAVRRARENLALAEAGGDEDAIRQANKELQAVIDAIDDAIEDLPGLTEDLSDAQRAVERANYRLAEELMAADPWGNRAEIREALGKAGLSGDEVVSVLEAMFKELEAQEQAARQIANANDWAANAAVLANAIVGALNAADQGGVTITLNALSGLDEAARQSLFREIDEYFRRKAGEN